MVLEIFLISSVISAASSPVFCPWTLAILQSLPVTFILARISSFLMWFRRAISSKVLSIAICAILSLLALCVIVTSHHWQHMLVEDFWLEILQCLGSFCICFLELLLRSLHNTAECDKQTAWETFKAINAAGLRPLLMIVYEMKVLFVIKTCLLLESHEFTAA